ncbi:hypothetical protein WR52_30390 (plasmid) [Bacillus cereus]|uniref:aminotransferase class I/II-fold pyridoxal phosphate-dependent enzyme n=1 Tax=Bacillus cereus TaxID=1396 RepID=UPI0007B6AE11|nr:aminotransferase class I/II-fold pyridoxal phosphate-dependent enzyme [Bacillus cereus]ANC23018.1 hypothetical protein WR52_30390 [Bacillus cereus]
MINLSENINFLYPNQETINEFKNSIELINNYPELKNIKLNKLVANQLDVLDNQLIITNGSLEAIDYFFKLNSQKTIGILQPTFWGYENCAVRNGCKVKAVKMKNPFEFTLMEIVHLLKETDAIVLCNPNNPSLAHIPLKDIEYLLRKFPNKNILIDETVLTFDEKYNTNSTKKLVNTYKNLFVCFSYSKILGIPGLRLGVLISNEDNINSVKNQIIPYSLGILPQIYLSQNYNLFPVNKEISNNIQNNFNYLIGKLPKGIVSNVVNKNYGFILIQFHPNVILDDLCLYLIEKEILVRNVTEAYKELGENWIRISSGNISDYERLIRAIYEYLEKKGEKIGIYSEE